MEKVNLALRVSGTVVIVVLTMALMFKNWNMFRNNKKKTHKMGLHDTPF